MEVGRLCRNPVEKAGNRRVLLERFGGFAVSGKLRVRKMRMDRAVTYRVDRDRLPASPAFGHGMVEFRAFSEGSAA